jgi:hypothetical protein
MKRGSVRGASGADSCTPPAWGVTLIQSKDVMERLSQKGQAMDRPAQFDFVRKKDDAKIFAFGTCDNCRELPKRLIPKDAFTIEE